MWEKIKQHPWIVGGIIGVVILVVLLSSSSSSATSPSTTSDTSQSSGNGDQLQAYLAGLNVQSAGISAAQDVQNKQTAAAVQVAQINASSQDNANTLAAQVAEYTTKLQADVTNTQTTSAAAVQEAQINAGVTNTQTVANALIQQSAIQADVTKSYIQTLPTIIGEQSQAAIGVAQANHPSCTSVLFGLFSSC